MRWKTSGMRAISRFIPVAILALTFAAPAAAQRGGGGGGGRGGGFSGGAPAQFARLETLETGFKLTKDQKKTVKTILDDAHKGAAPVRDALASAREAIAAAVQANKPQPEIDGAVSSYAEQAAAMTAIEMKALAQIVQTLDPEQRANTNGMRTAFFLMRGMFLDSKRWDTVPDTRSY